MQNNYDNATHNKHTTTTKIKEGIWSIGLGALQLSSTNKRSRPEILGTRRKRKRKRWSKNAREKMNKVESTRLEKMNGEYDENQKLTESDRLWNHSG